MAHFRVLLVGPVETVSIISHLLYLRHHDSRWETDVDVTPEDVRWCEVLIVDIGLKGAAGNEFVRRLTADLVPRPIVVVISNSVQPPAAETGIDAHLTKPVDPDGLLALVQRVRAFSEALAGTADQ